MEGSEHNSLTNNWLLSLCLSNYDNSRMFVNFEITINFLTTQIFLFRAYFSRREEQNASISISPSHHEFSARTLIQIMFNYRLGKREECQMSWIFSLMIMMMMMIRSEKWRKCYSLTLLTISTTMRTKTKKKTWRSEMSESHIRGGVESSFVRWNITCCNKCKVTNKISLSTVREASEMGSEINDMQ